MPLPVAAEIVGELSLYGEASNPKHLPNFYIQQRGRPIIGKRFRPRASQPICAGAPRLA
jgi:hypothetical protein